ncbi:hypothetical protein CIW48_24625 [Methylobacterium sp. P1-11]|uniref:propionyl-CoA synthetase n=1 Tax=Methylobacterium sp. P1-11 TaxID=2024616 RepID=UPI0011ED7F21|nr:propionyl-CoA synthetase [Methylobacterium sp. P1-11]KAA0121257.1 hypothetical protein CIW48_24625 [Methylobacterium sp. P1-11]
MKRKADTDAMRLARAVGRAMLASLGVPVLETGTGVIARARCPAGIPSRAGRPEQAVPGHRRGGPRPVGQA